jgi:hypothetical protein
MPTDLVTFEEETAFERLALDRALPLVAPDTGVTTLDLRGQEIRQHATIQPVTMGVSVFDTVGGSGRAALVADLRPLLFGAAWKVIDLAVEWAMHEAAIPPAGDGHYKIGPKTRAAGAGISPLAPFGIPSVAWDVTLAAYASTEVLRNDLVHRRATVLPDGALMPTQVPGGSTGKPLTAEQQESFCRVAQRLARALIEQKLEPRVEADMLSHLERLTDQHSRPVTGGVSSSVGILRVAVKPFVDDDENLALDVPAIRIRAQRVNPGPYYDLQIHLPNGEVLEADLERLPDAVISIDPANLEPAFRRR